MAIAPFLLEPKFININPVVQQTLTHLPRSPLNKLSYGGCNINALKLKYSCYTVIRYSPKLRSKCFFMSPNKPKQEIYCIGGNGVGGDQDKEVDISSSGTNEEVVWRSIKNVLIKTLQIPAGVLLGLLFLYDHHHALAASGGRMGGSIFSSQSSGSHHSSPSSSSSSSSWSSEPSSSSSWSSEPSFSSSSSEPSSTSSSEPSYSSSSWSWEPSFSSSSSEPSYSSSSWSWEPSFTSSSSEPSFSSSSSWSSSPRDEDPEPASSSSWWSSSSSKSLRSSSESETCKSYANTPTRDPSEDENGFSVGVEPAAAVGVHEPAAAVGVGPTLWVLFGICALVIIVWDAMLPDDSTAADETITIAAPKTVTAAAEKTSVLKLQVGLLGTARSLQGDLNRIADVADTSTPQGLSYILQETILALLRHPEYCISGYSSVDAKSSIVEVEELFNRLSIEERGKFDEETLVNVNNIRKQSAITKKSNDFHNEYIVITIIVAAGGVHELPLINSSAKLKETLQKLAAIPSSRIMAVEVLWTPQNENDTLTEREYLEDYSLLCPL